MKKFILIFVVYLSIYAFLFGDREMGTDIYGPVTMNTQNFSGAISSNIFGPVTINTQLYSGAIDSDIFGPVTINTRVWSGAIGSDTFGQVSINTNFVAPVNINIQPNGNFVTITWNAVCGATGYLVFSSNNPETGYSYDGNGSLNGTSWTSNYAPENKFYYVKAVK